MCKQTITFKISNCFVKASHNFQKVNPQLLKGESKTQVDRSERKGYNVSTIRYGITRFGHTFVFLNLLADRT